MKFPYGLSDFYKLVSQDYFYIDRTDRVSFIEDAGDQLVFLRPRRFGKSLLLSMLENYYDLAKADQFEMLFGHLKIGRNPTPLHNQYFVMKWDFSTVDSQGSVAEIKQRLHDHINGCINNFLEHYQDFLNHKIRVNPINSIASFQSLLASIQQTSHKLYLLIDEYDNFANEVMMGRQPSKDRYEELVYGEGILKTLFKAVKSAASGQGLDRAFITGVSPVVMSDLTSGYNVAKNIYLSPELNDLCGFTESEIQVVLVELMRECQLPIEQASEVSAMMRTFYNGYCFNERKTEFIYNPTLALYFLRTFKMIVNIRARCWTAIWRWTEENYSTFPVFRMAIS